MSDPALIEAIQQAVTIPVMAKARIGHFAEAQVLEALGVDYIDESEVLTPGRRGPPHRQVGVPRALRLRRHQPGRGPASHLRRGGADPLQGRGRHRQHRRGRASPPFDPGRHPRLDPGRSGRAVRLGQEPGGPDRAGPARSPRPAGSPFRCSAPAASPPRPTPPSSCSWAPRRCSSARASSRARTRRVGPGPSWRPPPTIDDAADRGQGRAGAWGRPCPGSRWHASEQRLAERGW